MSFCRQELLLYGITDRAGAAEQTLLQQIEAALKGGVTILQLREKHLDQDAFAAEAVEVKKLCHRYGVKLIINDNVEVALRSGADGVHVGMEDTPVAEIRKLAGEKFIIGATAKTVEQAKLAEKSGADYLGVGAVFPSPTKKNAIRITNAQLSQICGSVSIPAVAIGGIAPENVLQLKGSGIAGIAVVSALFGEADIRAAAENLREKAKQVVNP